jgi:hypothetical protein
MPDTWETTVRTAADTMLRHPDKISDGLEAELYALLEQLGTPKAVRPDSTSTPDDAALSTLIRQLAGRRGIGMLLVEHDMNLVWGF